MINLETLPASEALLLCPKCKVEMRLVGIEAHTPDSELYTFECSTCRSVEVAIARLQ